MMMAFKTDHLAERERVPAWIDVASRTFFDHQFDPKSGDFVGRLDAGQLDTLRLSYCECGPCEVTRTRRNVSSDGIDDIIMCIRLEGRSLFSQAERRVTIEPGTVMLQDAGRPMKVRFLEQTASIFLNIPRHMVQARIGDSNLDRVLTAGMPLAEVTSDFLSSVTERMHAIEPVAHRRLADQVLGLVSLAFTGTDGAAPLSSARANALRRLKAEIEKRLSAPTLTPSGAAAGAGMSVRYANALLAEEGTSLERYIQQRRLEQCRRALEDPLQSHRMVGELAFAWGFSDHSHFTRRFREAYGITPRECRERAGCAPQR